MTIRTQYFEPKQIEAAKVGRIPRHIAVIMDGNRRWARSHAENTATGHARGADTLMDVVKSAKELGISIITAYAFSTENWERPKDELATLFTLLECYLRDETSSMVENGVRLETIGDLTLLPEAVSSQVDRTKAATAHCKDITLILALNYGGRDEITRAVRHLIDDYAEKGLNSNEISEKTISKYLDTAQWPDPDLLIRTSGEMRISNFLLWQLSYTELYLTETLWPDFTPQHLLQAVLEYQGREQRMGR